jgi:hypothetical protein
MRNLYLILAFTIVIAACTKKQGNKQELVIMEKTINSVVDSLAAKYGADKKPRIERGVKQAAYLWRSEDGTEQNFSEFCMNNFIGDDSSRYTTFQHLNDYFEAILGHFNNMTLLQRKVMDLDLGPILTVDEMFSSFDAGAHLTDDLYDNKIAFLVILNFPHYTLAEKNENISSWSKLDWSYARMGDSFTSRVPAKFQQNLTKVSSDGERYISEYNLYVGQLLNDSGKTLFRKNMKLLSHWSLRDEIKANYGKSDGFEKQKLIYEAMKHIIDQTIPVEIINNENYEWNPYSNTLYKGGKEIKGNAEPDTRYAKIVNNFRALKDEDQFFPVQNTFIKRKFEGGMEIPQEEVEKLFVEFVSSPEVKEVAGIIKKRLGRNLEPYDIWYDGFKARSSYTNDDLDAKTKAKYKNTDDFQKGISGILAKLNFPKEEAQFIQDRVDVDPARGSGHAWGAQMRSQHSHLRTRIGSNGMDYKGFNIAMHELGHTVEQTISLHKVDNFAISGIPNVATTEALAFIFQRRDLDILGLKDNNPDKKYLSSLDDFWSVYEIMGVSLVDMSVWKWLYNNPTADEHQLKQAVLDIAKEVWNKYYADVFGVKDQIILGIYSHMVENPLYLSSYPMGHIIDFQIERFIEGKTFGKEISRIYSIGRLTPKAWMKEAVGEEISIKPMLKSADEAIAHFK